jgi:hypothetical protein
MKISGSSCEEVSEVLPARAQKGLDWGHSQMDYLGRWWPLGWRRGCQNWGGFLWQGLSRELEPVARQKQGLVSWGVPL